MEILTGSQIPIICSCNNDLMIFIWILIGIALTTTANIAYEIIKSRREVE